MEKENIRTFEARVPFEPHTEEVLTACADLLSPLERRLFADIASGKRPGELKNNYLASYDITARHFNSLRVLVEGKINSIKKRLPDTIANIKNRITSLSKKIKYLIKTKADSDLIHQKKRKLGNLEHKLSSATEDRKNEIVRCCFGSKKLFHAQYNLEENGYASHEEWLQSWQESRSSELFFLGSKDETAGNQTCTATLKTDQTLQLRIRLPQALEKYGKYLVISGITFKYGKDEQGNCMINILTNAAHRQLGKNAGTPSTLDWPAKKWRLSMRRGCQEIYHAISL